MTTVEQLGGKPSQGTPKDKRLKENARGRKSRLAVAPDDEADEDGECPDGQHMMPNGECMPDEDMYVETEELDGPFRTWSGVITVEGRETGDGREFAVGSLEWPDLDEVVVPLMWQEQSEPQHLRAIQVGRITEMERRDTPDPNVKFIWARGIIKRDAQITQDIDDQMAGGISVDVDSVKQVDVEAVFIEEEDGVQEVVHDDGDVITLFGPPPDKFIFHRGRIRGATLVALPAFVEAQISLESDDAVDSFVRAATAGGEFATSGSTDLPVADRDRAWDGAGARTRVLDMCTSGDSIDVACASRAFLWRDPNQDPQNKGAYHLGFADVVDGQLKIIPRGVAATAGGRGVGAVAGLSSADRSRIESKICSLYAKVRSAHDDWPECPFSRTSADLEEVVTASAKPPVAPLYPPKSWFHDPKLTGPTSWTITDDGRVFGHLALWSTCHTTFPDRCITPPREYDFPFFMKRELKTEERDTVAVGQITLGTGHASLGLGAVPAASHYDNTGLAAADIAVGEDRYGIWVAGALRSTLDEVRLRELRAASLSGDWRRIAGRLRLVAVLAVNVPGYPVPRTRSRSDEYDTRALVAAGVVTNHRVELIENAVRSGHIGTIRVRRR